MAFTNSKFGRQTLADIIGNTTAMDWDADTTKAALFGNGITPAENVVASQFAYNGGVWTTGAELTSSGQWAAGGVALGSKTVDVSTNGVVMLDAADTASGSAATLSGVYGTLVYDDTIASPVADQAWCFNYLGGSNSVTSGTFTIIWAAGGIARFTV